MGRRLAGIRGNKMATMPGHVTPVMSVDYNCEILVVSRTELVSSAIM